MNINFKYLSALFVFIMSSMLITLPAWAAESPQPAKKVMVSEKSNAVNINKATAKELSKNLKGIGKTKAEAIIAYRDSNGEFKKIEDLLKVKGIGKKMLENNKDRIDL